MIRRFNTEGQVRSLKTWTPTIEGASSSGDYTVSSDDANRYIQVGGVCHLWGRLDITVNSAGSGYIRLGGLPFDHYSDPILNAILEPSNLAFPSNTIYLTTTREVNNPESFVNIAAIKDGASKERLDVSAISTGTEIRLYLGYLVNL